MAPQTKKVTPDEPVNDVIAVPPVRITLHKGLPNEDIIDINPKQMSAGLVRETQNLTGHSLLWWIQQVANEPDIHVVSTLVWVGRKQRGDTGPRSMPLTIEMVDATIGYADLDHLEMSIDPDNTLGWDDETEEATEQGGEPGPE